jgi:hypothetical protein
MTRLTDRIGRPRRIKKLPSHLWSSLKRTNLIVLPRNLGGEDQDEMPAIKNGSISRDRDPSLQEVMCADLIHM